MADNIRINITSNAPDTQRNLQTVLSYMNQIQARRVSVSIDSNSVNTANQRLEDFENTLTRVSNAMSDLSGLSNMFGDIAAAFGDAFSGMSKIASISIPGQVFNTLTDIATSAVVGNLEKIRSRFDIMSTFADYMELAGISADEANDALQRVNDSILGLPIGLDESAQRLRRYQMFMDDLEGATNLTIGVQKAITAGGASASMKNQAYMQIDRLLTSGQLAQSKQWLSLMNGLGVSMRFIREAMGVEDMTNKDLAAGLTKGTISTEQFLQALMDLGEGSSSAAKKLDAALSIYKGTLESWISNIQFAAIRGGETVLRAVNDTLLDTTGKPIIGYMEIVRNNMNDFYKGVAGYIEQNPQHITTGLDAVERFLDVLREFSASRLANKIFERSVQTLDLFTNIIGDLNPERTEDFIAFATTIAGPLGKLFKVFQDGLPTLYGIFERFEDFDFNYLFERVLENAQTLADIVADVLGLFSNGVLSETIAFGLVYARPAAEAITVLNDALKYLGRSISGLSNVRDFTLLSAIIKFASDHYIIAAAAAAVGGLALALGPLRRAQDNDIANAFGIYKYDALIEESQKFRQSLDEDRNAFNDLMRDTANNSTTGQFLFGKILGNHASLSGFLGEARRKDLIEEQADYIKQLNDLYPGLNLKIDKNTGLLDENSKQIVANSKSLMDYYVIGTKAENYLARAANLRLKNEELASRRDTLDKSITDAYFEIAQYELEIDRLKREKHPEDPNWSPEKEITNYQGASQLTHDRIALLREERDAVDELIRQNETLAQSYFDSAEAANQEAREIGQRVGQFLELTQEEKIANVAEKLGYTEEVIKELTESFDDLYEAVYKSLSGIVTGFGEMEDIGSTTLDKMTQNVQKQVKLLEGLDANIGVIEEFLGTYDVSDGLKQALGEVLANPGAYIPEIDVFADEIGKAMASGTEDAFSKLDFLGSLVAEKNELLQSDSLRSAAASMASQLGDAIIEVASEDPSLFGDAFNKLIETWVPDEEKLSTMASNINDAIVPADETVNAAQEAYGAVTEAVDRTMKKIGGEDESLDAALTRLEGNIDTFNEDTMPAFEAVLDSGGKVVQSFTDVPLENMRTKLDGGEGSVSFAVASLNGEIVELGECMVARTQNEFVTFNSGLQDIINKLGDVQSAARSLANELSSLASIDTDISLPSVGGTSGGGVYPSTGGLIYLAKGGLSNLFKPRGTDTVPAMLTPGEFVVRKKAVDHIGAGVLSMINRMDIPNAIDALMSRVRMPMGHQFVTYDNRNSYDNHATVNQTINTNNPSFTYRRASRFAHAL